MTNLFTNIYNNFLKPKPKPKISSLDIILETDGTHSEHPSNNYTSINDNLQKTFLIPPSNKDTSQKNSISINSNYNPPGKSSSTSNKNKEESPFSKFRIWGQ
jgi:hypothetical protein